MFVMKIGIEIIGCDDYDLIFIKDIYQDLFENGNHIRFELVSPRS